MNRNNTTQKTSSSYCHGRIAISLLNPITSNNNLPFMMIASPYSYESSPLSEIEALERGALAVIVSLKNGHPSRRSSTSSFLSSSPQFSTSSLSSITDAAAEEEVGVTRGVISDITTYDRGSKRGGSWVRELSLAVICRNETFFLPSSQSSLISTPICNMVYTHRWMMHPQHPEARPLVVSSQTKSPRRYCYRRRVAGTSSTPRLHFPTSPSSQER